MAANTYLEVTEVDFDDIRNNLKNYLSSQAQFQDYDFEGSNMAVLLDLLAYNTHYNAFYVNMLANEMFLDTAQQRDSVVSRAKELGYLTRSARGATANVTVTFTGVANTVSSFPIPKNSKFTTTIDDISYTFITFEAHTVLNSSNTFSHTFEIREGEPLTQRFVVNTSDPDRYILPNENVDTRSITVTVQESATNLANTAFTLASNIRGIDSTSPVYYLQETSDKKYELIFSKGSLGKPLRNGNIVIVDYAVCNGTVTNGANSFTIDTINTGVPYTSASLSVNRVARGGVEQEDVESIKFNAPRMYEIQNRAIIQNDYARIILNENSDLQSVTAFGGELADPPVYGKVYIAIKPEGEQIATIERKSLVRASIIDRVPLAVDPIIIDPDYTYIIPTVTSYYDKLKTTLTQSQFSADVKTAIANFNTTNLSRFGNKLRYSRFVRALDNVNDAVLNTEVSLKIQKRFTPDVNQPTKVSLKFSNALRANSILSTGFTYNGFAAFFSDDGNGNIDIFRYSQSKVKTNIVTGAGTVNYDTGLVEVENFAPTAYVGIEIKVNAETVSLDITPVREQILILNSEDATVTAIGENG